MSKSLNKVQLIGTLGRDAETKFTTTGKAVTNFSIATTESWKDSRGDQQEKTSWHNIVMWSVEKLAPYLTKGSKIYVEGKLETRQYEDRAGEKKYTTEVIASDVILLSSKKDSGNEGSRDNPQYSNQGSYQGQYQGDHQGHNTDDVPF